MSRHIIELLSQSIPNDHSRQVNSQYFVEKVLAGKKSSQIKVLDIGCGGGNSVDIFAKLSEHIQWFGLDIEDSPEVRARTREDCAFYTFDGIHIPFDDNSFDIIYSNQVFEHVRYPQKLLEEISRVLKVDGTFIGSTSHLEPFHSFSYWNYTPYGFMVLCNDTNLRLEEIRPSIDALALIVACILGIPKFTEKWWAKDSPLNKIISIFGALKKFDHQKLNAQKLTFCGQFCFLITKQN